MRSETYPMRRAAIVLFLAVCASVSGHAAGRAWRSIRGRNVIVYGQQSANRLRDVAVEIEQFRLVVGDLIHGARQPLPLPTLVFAFDDADALRPYVPFYRGKPISLAGFCHCGSADDLNVIAASLHRGDETSSIVFHEYSHLLIRNAARNVPLWLNEGLAEYFSTFSLRNNGREAVVGRPLVVHLALLNQRLMPVSELLSVGPSSPMYNEGDRRSIFYAEAWALTHYLLIDRPGGAEAINRYLAAAEKGTHTPESLAEAVGMTLKELDLELARYVRHPAFGQMTLKLKDRVGDGDLQIDEPEAARAVPDAEAEARLGDLLLRVGRVEEAEPRIEAAAALGGNNATAQLTLGLLRVREGRDPESVPPLQRAAALAPDDFISQYLFALTMLRRALDLDVEKAEETLIEAREALGRALKANPDSAAALAWHAYADMELDIRWDEARDQTLRAIALSPGRADYQLQLALIHLRRQETEAAGRTLLAMLAQTATEEPVIKRARGVLLELRERDARAANAPPLWRSRALRGGPPQPIDVGPADKKTEDHADTGAMEFRLRKPQAGEERALGDLVALDCSPSGIRFHVRLAGARPEREPLGERRVIIATAAKMEDVEMTSFVDDKDFAVACGAHASPERVYITWRSASATRDGSAGTAVAVEFLPKHYVP